MYKSLENTHASKKAHDTSKKAQRLHLHNPVTWLCANTYTHKHINVVKITNIPKHGRKHIRYKFSEPHNILLSLHHITSPACVPSPFRMTANLLRLFPVSELHLVYKLQLLQSQVHETHSWKIASFAREWILQSRFPFASADTQLFSAQCRKSGQIIAQCPVQSE